jgi:hypothetical protein
VPAALSGVDLHSGQRRTGAQGRTEVLPAAQRRQAIDNAGSRHVATYLTNRAPGVGCDATALPTPLGAVAGDYAPDSVSRAAVIRQVSDDLPQGRRPWQQLQPTQHLLGAYPLWSHRLGDPTDPLMTPVQRLWQQRHRASSAMEGFNASLRPYL